MFLADEGSIFVDIAEGVWVESKGAEPAGLHFSKFQTSNSVPLGLLH
jgi:hypothetical protein